MKNIHKRETRITKYWLTVESSPKEMKRQVLTLLGFNPSQNNIVVLLLQSTVCSCFSIILESKYTSCAPLEHFCQVSNIFGKEWGQKGVFVCFDRISLTGNSWWRFVTELHWPQFRSKLHSWTLNFKRICSSQKLPVCCNLSGWRCSEALSGLHYQHLRKRSTVIPFS